MDLQLAITKRYSAFHYWVIPIREIHEKRIISHHLNCSTHNIVTYLIIHLNYNIPERVTPQILNS